jgi:DNA modification methylase
MANKHNKDLNEKTRKGLGVYASGGGVIARHSNKPLSSLEAANSDINGIFGRPENAGCSPSQTGTSIFDPVLCEVIYSWFSPTGGTVLDPFAGGSVRGIVASVLGLSYTGIDLSERQISANREQAALIVPDNCPVWIVGDSREIIPDDLYDFVFSCPPYADLEVYSNDPRDISTMDYEDFKIAYRDIIRQCVTKLKNNRFACFVVGDIRDRKGFYRGFVSDTIHAFRDAGTEFYNEAILITAIGSLPLRAGKQFRAGRKLGKTHQNILVFVKGDPKKATLACGDVGVMDLGKATW